MDPVRPRRGEIWYAALDPVRGHEQAGRRPAVVISADALNQGPAELAIVVPMTMTDRGIPWHVAVYPPEGGLREKSLIKCEDVRSISHERLGRRLGVVSGSTLAQVEEVLRTLMGL